MPTLTPAGACAACSPTTACARAAPSGRTSSPIRTPPAGSSPRRGRPGRPRARDRPGRRVAHGRAARCRRRGRRPRGRPSPAAGPRRRRGWCDARPRRPGRRPDRRLGRGPGSGRAVTNLALRLEPPVQRRDAGGGAAARGVPAGDASAPSWCNARSGDRLAAGPGTGALRGRLGEGGVLHNRARGGYRSRHCVRSRTPKVESALVRLERRPAPPVDVPSRRRCSRSCGPASRSAARCCAARCARCSATRTESVLTAAGVRPGRARRSARSRRMGGSREAGGVSKPGSAGGGSFLARRESLYELERAKKGVWLT